MSQQSSTQSLTGDFIYERAVRRGTARRRRAGALAPAGASAAASAAGRTADQVGPSPAGIPRILRRWSVAELIARAATVPPATVPPATA